MDADSPLISRVERTFWTVWYYITGAVHRVLRPEPENSVSNNPESLQESAVDSDLAKCHDEEEVRGGEVQGEQTIATDSPLSSSRPAVACTTEIGLGPNKKYIQYTAEFRNSKTDEDTREEELIRAGYGESRLLVAKNNKADKDKRVNQELYTHRQAKTLEYDKNESMITRSQIITKNALRSDMAGTLEETEKIAIPDIQSLEEIPIKVQDQEEYELNFETDSIEIKHGIITDVHPKEIVNMHKEETSGQRNLAEAEITISVLLLASGNENKSDEDTLKDDSEDLTDEELQMASNTSVPVSEDELIVAGLEYAMAPRNSNEKSDIVNEKRESPMEKGGQKVVTEDEKVNKAEELEQTDEIQTVTGDSKEEVNFTTQMCKIAQEGVPEYINEPESDENTTQRFLEVGHSKEVQSTPLPEEVESQEPESLHNSGRNTEADCFVVREDTEKGQENKEQRKGNLDLVGSELQQRTKKLHFETLIQKAGPVSVDENRKSLVLTMKTGIDYLEKESESNFGFTNEKDLHVRAEDILVEMDEELWDPKEADDAQKKFMETKNLDIEETVRLFDAGEQIIQTCLQDSVDAVSLGQNINETLSLIGNITATGFLKQSVVTELQLLTEVEQYAETDLEKASYGVVQHTAEEVVGPELGTAKCPETELSNEKQTKTNEEQHVESNSWESELVSDKEMSLSTAESGFSDQSLCDLGTQNSESHLLKSVSTGSIQGMFDMFGNVSESASIPKLAAQQHGSECQDTLMRGTDEPRQSYLKHTESVMGFCPGSAVVKILNKESEETKDNTDEDSGSQKGINTEEKGLLGKKDLKNTKEADVKSLTKVSTLFRVQKATSEAEAFVITLSESQDESKLIESAGTRNLDAWSEEGISSVESSLQDNTSAESDKGSLKLPLVDNPKHKCWEDTLDSVSRQDRAEVEDQLTTKSEYQSEVDVSALDFTAQRSRIALKNPHVRPPKDPHSLILMSSLDPTPDPHLLAKVPLGGMGIGIKLRLDAGFPVLKKMQQIGKDETRPESNPQESEAKSEETSDAPKQEETHHKCKWMPSGHPGFGNPLMSELKTRLNKVTKD